MAVKILMVCLGNICRSPLAQGILESKLSREKFIIDSAGTGSWHIGSQPDQRSIEIAKKHKIDISLQKARQIKLKDLDTFDYVYAMDKTNYKDIVLLSENQTQKNKIKIILNEQFPNENRDIPDPYFGSENDFALVYSMLDEVCVKIAQKLIKKYA